MVDFKKKLGNTKIEKKVNPIEIYDSLDRRSETGPLRPAQDYILKNWFEKRSGDKDLIIKLHTGEGKTLIGLLILQSKLNSNESTCLYICPNIYLANQVILEAEKFGIPYCLIEEGNTFPNDFIDGRKILITHIQKLFNGRTIFGLNNVSLEIDNIVIDDSHACIDAIKESFTIRFRSDHPLYKYILNLFAENIKDQGEGTYLEIASGEYESLLPIPYWCWLDRKSEILSELTKFREDPELLFSWAFIKDHLDNYQAFIAGKFIEISPYHIPIHHFGSFANASHRVLMSATTQDDSFFIKGLGFTKVAINNPLLNPLQKWSGEKMILIPSLIHNSLSRDLIINMFGKKAEKQRFGVVFITTSFRRTELYDSIGCLISNADNLFKHIKNLKNRVFEGPLVIVNRYDGIDLPDEACRLLIIDSKPFFNSLVDKYEESCRSSSDYINIKIAQRIEQGIGRSVRGEKDYSAIILIGDDLIRFIKSSKTNKYFSDQMRKQVDIGLNIAHMSQEDLKAGKSPQKVLIDLLSQCINRDEGWKAFYNEEMATIKQSSKSENLYDILEEEYKAEIANYYTDFEKASQTMQSLIDNHIHDQKEKGWYLQHLARYIFPISKANSNQLQKSAFLKNRLVMKPKEGITYNKLEYINENRVRRIKNWISPYSSYQDLIISIDGILSDFEFGIEADKFETAVKDIGEMLGFLSERPDKEHKKGPDNLWCGVENQYFVFECKSEVDVDRAQISKQEAGQMNNHCGWFESEYGDSPVVYVMIIPTKHLTYSGNFTHNIKIMKRARLNKLRKNIKNFFIEFKDYAIHEIGDSKMQEFIDHHKLDIKSLKTEYIEDVIQEIR